MKMLSIPALLLCGLLMSGCLTKPVPPKTPRAMIVVPARLAPIRMAQDMATLRPDVVLVSYRGKPNELSPELYFWRNDRWNAISIDDFSEPDSYINKPEVIMIFASGNNIPSVIIEAVTWSDNIEFKNSLDVETMLSSFNEAFAFSEPEFRALASRYGLTLTDTNAQRRKNGRYGPKSSNSKYPAPAEAQETGLITPIQLSE